MELAEVKKHIADILKKENIKHVYHVDDRIKPLESKQVAIIAYLRRIERIENDKRLVQIFSEQGIDTSEDIDFIIDEVSKMLTIENMIFVNNLMAHFGLNEIDQKGGDDAEDNDASDIHKYFPNGQFSAVEPKDAVEKIVRKVGAIGDDGKVLVLFDFDLKEAGGEFATVTGAELLIRLKERDNKNQCICSIFTHLVKDSNDEIHKRNEIISGREDKFDKINLFVLAKKRKTDPLLFGDGIKKAILNPIYEKIKIDSISLLTNAFEESCKELGSIDTYEFDHMILHASNVEGVWAGETLLRIFNVIFDKNVRNQFVGNNYAKTVNPFFEKAIKLAKNSFPAELREIPELNKNRIRNLELYVEKDLLNPLYEPISNGDVFEIIYGDQRNTYILVGQECDIVLRSDGKRNRKNDFFTLLKVDFKQKAEVEKDIEQFTRSYGLKNYFFSNKFLLNNYDNNNSELVGIVDFKNELIVYAKILDLTSFNADGTAKFDDVAEYPTESYCQALRNRFKIVTRLCRERLNSIKSMEDELTRQGVQDAKKFAIKFIETASPTNQLAGNPYPYNSEVFDFGITRSKRLKSLWANRLLERYGYYLSRAAELPDFTDLVEPKDLKIN